jgi:C4-type Zn-finger protein
MMYRVNLDTHEVEIIKYPHGNNVHHKMKICSNCLFYSPDFVTPDCKTPVLAPSIQTCNNFLQSG